MMPRVVVTVLLLTVAWPAFAQDKRYAAPRTPWGHPDLQGTYSNDDETGTPMERPAQFAGKRQEDLTPDEFAALVKDRNEAFVKTLMPHEATDAAAKTLQSSAR